MEIKAIARNVRISPKKTLLIVNKIKKMKPKDAVKILEFIPQSIAQPLKKVVLSAIANAKNNYGFDIDSLTFKQIMVSKGPVFKRYQPISRGRVHRILKRTSHILVIVEGLSKQESSLDIQPAVVNKQNVDIKKIDKKRLISKK